MRIAKLHYYPGKESLTVRRKWIALIAQGRLPKLRGQVCWDVRYRTLGFIEMGTPRLHLLRFFHKRKFGVRDVRTDPGTTVIYVRGHWGLRFLSVNWRVQRRGLTIATLSSSKTEQRRALAYLEGQRLMAIHVHVETGATRFTFDHETTLELRRRRRGDRQELWVLDDPSGYYLSVYSDGTFRRAPGSGLDTRRSFSGPIAELSVGWRTADGAVSRKGRSRRSRGPTLSPSAMPRASLSPTKDRKRAHKQDHR